MFVAEKKEGEEPQAPSIDKVRQIWNDCAPAFSESHSVSTSQLAYVLAVQAQLGSCKGPVLEVGTGAGFGTRLIRFLLPSNVRLVSVDLAQSFLDIAKKNLEGLDVELLCANAEDLSGFQNESFDRYMANFVLHLTTDATAMLKEARRVLKKGGIAAFTVWGRPENSPHFTIPPNVAKEMNLEVTKGPPGRSNFYMGGDLEIARKMALEAGFSHAYTWYQLDGSDTFDAVTWATRHCRTPALVRLFEEIGEAKAAEFKEKMVQQATAILDSGRPITLESVYLVAIA